MGNNASTHTGTEVTQRTGTGITRRVNADGMSQTELALDDTGLNMQTQAEGAEGTGTDSGKALKVSLE